MNQTTYQSYLATKQAYDAAYNAVYHELIVTAEEAGDMARAHPDSERISRWIEDVMGFDGSFERYHVFQHSSESQSAIRWSQASDGSFVLTRKETYGEHYSRHYTIPATWAFARRGVECTALIQVALDSIAADAKAHDAAKEAEQEKADRAWFEVLKERFEP